MRQLSDDIADAEFHVFQPRDAVRIRWGGGGPGSGAGVPVGQNPPSGAQVFFILSEAPDSAVTVEILENGEVIRTYTSDSTTAKGEGQTAIKAPTAGLNRFAWNFRRETTTAVTGLMSFGSLAGRLVTPGDYEVRFNMGARRETVPLTVLPDPRWNSTETDYAAQDRFLAQAGEVLEEMHQGLNELRGARTQVEELVSRTAEHAEADTLEAAAGALNDGITEWEGELAQPKQKTFQDVINFENKLNAEFLSLIGSVDGTPPPVIQGARDRLADLLAEWSTHRSTMNDLFQQLEAFNRLVQDLGIPPIVVKRAPPRVISRAQGARTATVVSR